jgi:hypothetical protein
LFGFVIVLDESEFVCTFEDDSCRLFSSADTKEQWQLVDGNGIIPDNTLNLGLYYNFLKIFIQHILIFFLPEHITRVSDHGKNGGQCLK